MVLLFALYVYHAFDHFHWHLTHFYAHHWDDAHAQHVMGHKILARHNASGERHAHATGHWARVGDPRPLHHLAAASERHAAHVNVSHAFHWFRKAADKGHPESAYNLAVGHLSGYKTDVRKGEVKRLLKYAAANGVIEAKQLLNGLCKEKPAWCEH